LKIIIGRASLSDLSQVVCIYKKCDTRLANWIQILEEVTTEREEYHGDFDCHIIIKMKGPIGDFVRNSNDVPISKIVRYLNFS
jgi:hypothetical protein